MSRSVTPPLSRLVERSLPLLSILATWQIAAWLAARQTLPSPGAVFTFAVEELLHGALLPNLGITLWRVAAAFVIAMLIGAAIGIASGQLRRGRAIFDMWLLLLLNMPVLVIAVMCYIWLGLTETAAIAAVAINKIPNVVVILREGMRELDPKFDEMSTVYRFSFGNWLGHVVLPQLAPYFAAAARSGLALIWKIVLVVELLGRPSGVGYAISLYFQLFDMRGVLAYTLAFTVIMVAIEHVFLRPVEAYVRRWNPATA